MLSEELDEFRIVKNREYADKNTGTVLLARVEKGTKPGNRFLFFGTRAMRNALGSRKCLFKVEANGRNTFCLYNPRRQRYQYLVPDWIGEKGQRIQARVKPISDREVLETVNQQLPFKLSVEENRGTLEFNGLKIPVSARGFRWSRKHNAPCLEAEFRARDMRDGVIKNHTIRIVYKDKTGVVINFGKTKGTVRSVEGGTLPGEIVINYLDFKEKHFKHRIVPENLEKLLFKLKTEGTGLKNEYPLNESEVAEVRKTLALSFNNHAYGNLIRNKIMKEILEAGEILGRRVIRGRAWWEVRIPRTFNRVDLAFESINGGLLIVEVKSTTEVRKTWELFREAVKALKVDPGYIKLIGRYGLYIGREIRKNVEAYIAVATYIDLEEKTLKIRHIKEVKRTNERI